MSTAISLFSGCGGSDKGLVRAGCQVVMANDLLPYAEEVYKANLPETEFRLCNVGQVTEFPTADILAGCYPCQGYSQGGARDKSRAINYLYRQFDRALRKTRPKALIVENVSGMARSNNRQFLDNQLIRFQTAGYRVDWKIINGAEYGLPQERRRIFIVGIRSDLGVRYKFPGPTHGQGLIPMETQRDCLSETDGTWPTGEYYNHGFHWYYLSRDRYRGWDSPSKTVLANARHMPLHPMSPCLQKTGHNCWEFQGKPEEARRLSYREAAVLQGMEGWEFPDTVSLMTKYKVIGNAVPPIMFQRIVEALPEGILNA